MTPETIALKLTDGEVRAVRDRNPLSYGQALARRLDRLGLITYDRYEVAGLSPLGIQVRDYLEKGL
jgi:Fe2+ transport system protein FeoA